MIIFVIVNDEFLTVTYETYISVIKCDYLIFRHDNNRSHKNYTERSFRRNTEIAISNPMSLNVSNNYSNYTKDSADETRKNDIHNLPNSDFSDGARGDSISNSDR